jgi:hypothetical protein
MTRDQTIPQGWYMPGIVKPYRESMSLVQGEVRSPVLIRSVDARFEDDFHVWPRTIVFLTLFASLP